MASAVVVRRVAPQWFETSHVHSEGSADAMAREQHSYVYMVYRFADAVVTRLGRSLLEETHCGVSGALPWRVKNWKKQQ